MPEYNQLSIFDNPNEQRPLPELIAAGGHDWAAFPLAFQDVHDIRYYAVQDWIRGVSMSDDPRKIWDAMKRRAKWSEAELSTWLRQLPYRVANGRQYKMDHATAEGLYTLTQRLGINTGVCEKVLKYLAKSGVKLDELRLDSDARIEIADTQVAKWHKEGKSEMWIIARLQGVIARREFTDALKNAILNIQPADYAQATEKVYRGLWDRTAAQLRGDLNLAPRQNPRDGFSEYALIYTRLAEKLAADRLGSAETVSTVIAMEIVWDTAKLIQVQARATQQALGIDLVTGQRLLE